MFFGFRACGKIGAASRRRRQDGMIGRSRTTSTGSARSAMRVGGGGGRSSSRCVYEQPSTGLTKKIEQKENILSGPLWFSDRGGLDIFDLMVWPIHPHVRIPKMPGRRDLRSATARAKIKSRKVYLVNWYRNSGRRTGAGGTRDRALRRLRGIPGIAG